jgi:CRISPR-associated protein Cas1
VLLRAAREDENSADCKTLGDAAGYLARITGNLPESAPLDTVRGNEGDAARRYFSVFNCLIRAQKEAFFFHERSRRPLGRLRPAGRSAPPVEAVGLDPAVGYLHRDRPGRPSLALDLMEEFRAFLADRLALSLVNRQQVKGAGFKKTETGAIMMDDETRKEVLVAYQKRKQEEIQHPFIDEKVAVGLLPHVQSMLLARYLRGDLDAYPAFFWK